MSWHPDRGGCAVDSLSYAFPPFCIIGKVLTKVRKDQSLLLVIKPAWQTQPWYTTLRSMSVHHPSLTQSDHIATRLLGTKPPFTGRQPTTFGGMAEFRKAFKSDGVSKLAVTLITNSRRSRSISITK